MGSSTRLPAIELDLHGDVAQGLLFTSEVLDEHWARLDEFEGDRYERVLTEAVLPTGHTAEAFIDVLRRSRPA